METKFDTTVYLTLVQERDTQERYSNLSIILSDTYELTKQLIALRVHLNQQSDGQISSYEVENLKDKIRNLELDL